MIIFDTNAVNELSPNSPRADIIRKLQQSGHHRVAVPWMVLEEMAAHQAKLYPVKYEAVTNTLDRLRAILPLGAEEHAGAARPGTADEPLAGRLRGHLRSDRDQL
ncbi:hypothetical protein [Streptomyces sp. NPDC005533]|uniref:hypothetical protein n=1 Tax=Streptomyces sp. NPDC005533 TaxID=3364723 RepID=UPI003688D768